MASIIVGFLYQNYLVRAAVRASHSFSSFPIPFRTVFFLASLSLVPVSTLSDDSRISFGGSSTRLW